MKKTLIVLSLVVAILVLAVLILPLVFKGKIERIVNEKITATATALVKVNILQEQFSTETNGQQRLYLELEAHIDEQEILQLLNKQQELQQLSQKVEQLEQKLNQLPTAPVVYPSSNAQKSFWGE